MGRVVGRMKEDNGEECNAMQWAGEECKHLSRHCPVTFDTQLALPRSSLSSNSDITDFYTVMLRQILTNAYCNFDKYISILTLFAHLITVSWIGDITDF